MKKYGLLIFILAFIIGLAVTAKVSIADSMFGKSFSFGFNRIQGSGVSKTESRDVKDFIGVDVSGALNVEVTAGESYGVEVTADDNILEHLTTEVSNNQLKIYLNKWVSTKTKISIKVNMPKIEELEVSGASNVNVANIKSENFNVNISGASKIEVSGESTNVETDLSGASRINAENLKAKVVSADLSGASNGVFAVSEKLIADASGASSIRYIGEPEISKNTSGASSIKRKE